MTDNICFDTAYKLATMGYSVIPSGASETGKAPMVPWAGYQDTPPDIDQIQAWENEHHPVLWGIVLNKDVAVIDTDTPELRIQFEKLLGRKANVVTPRGGGHFYIDTSGYPFKTAAPISDKYPKVDCRGVGGFVNSIGKNPKTGQGYQLNVLPVPGDLLHWSKLPPDILQAVTYENSNKPAPVAPSLEVHEGQGRNQACTRETGRLCNIYKDEATVKELIRAYNNTCCKPPLSEAELEATCFKSIQKWLSKASSGGDKTPINYEDMPVDTKSYPLTDAGNGEAVAFQWRHQVRYVYEWRAWIIYDKGRWIRDTRRIIRKLAIQTMRQLYRESSIVDNPDERKRIAKWYIESESDRRIKAALEFAIAQPGISVEASEVDNKPWLLNVKNGTINLRTGILRTARPIDLLTQQIDVNYNADATSEEWNKFLSTIFNANDDLIDYVQRGIGYTLNGKQLDRVFFFLYGQGINGKTQLMIALRRVLGPYAFEAKPELFMEKKFAGSGPDEGQASLKGIRLLTATEIKRNQSLDTSLVKRMTGGEPIWHERKYQSGFSFTPTHTLWLSGNHEPRIKDTTDSIWDRLNKLPFECRISADNEIKGYGEKLATKYGEAILNWCIHGAAKWLERGLTSPPECVVIANKEYRASQDLLHDFLLNVSKDPSVNITTKDMYNAYTEFCKIDDVDPLGKKSFNNAMRERGFRDKRGNKNKTMWIGVVLGENVTNVTKVTDFQETFPTCARNEKLLEKQATKVTNGQNQAQNGVTFDSKSNPNLFENCEKCGSDEWEFTPDGDLFCGKCGGKNTEK
jgi:P4 family phage/plasmid primase-like protien